MHAVAQILRLFRRRAPPLEIPHTPNCAACAGAVAIPHLVDVTPHAPSPPPPADMPLAAHVAALLTWAADIERLPDGAVLAAELKASYQEMCLEHYWHTLPWDLVAAAVRAATGLAKRYAWVQTPAGARRMCVYDLPGPHAGLCKPPNYKAAKAVGQRRGAAGRFVREPHKIRRAA